MTGQADQTAAFGRAFQRIAAMAQTDPEIAGIMPDPVVTEAMQAPGLSLAEVIARALAGYADRPALGSRAYEVREGRRHYRPEFATITYRELARQVEAVASAWGKHPVHTVRPGEFACFIAFTSAEMTAMDLACAYAQVIAVPLQANLPAPDIMQVFEDTRPAVLVATIDSLDLATGYALQVPSVRSLVVIEADGNVDEDRTRIADATARLAQDGGRVALIAFADLVAWGAQHPWTPLPRHPDGTETLTMLMYTSGSTGTPKGAIIHEAMCSQLWTAAPPMPAIQLAYAPLNHFMGRNCVFNTLARGGIVHFTLRSDMSTLFEDIRIARPTFLMFMPRVVEILYQQYQSELQHRIAAGEDPVTADAAVRAAMAKVTIGDRVVAGGVGSAPTAPAVQQFVRECFDIAFSNGYSSTEGSSTALISGEQVQRNVVIDYRLIDVPELGYYTTDSPHPRGELLVKSRLAIKGYFKQPEATAAVFDADGWLHTGDIMEEPGPDRLRWIDRRNNVIKLSQAEYVAVGPVEATLLGASKLIRQIYVYGNSYRSFLLAVVVPDIAVARTRLRHEPSLEELRALSLADLQEAARTAGLKSFEVPRDVLIEMEPFTHENGLLSSVRKPLRPKLKARYQDALEAMYLDMERQQQDQLARLRHSGNGLSTLDRVAGALMATLGLAEVNPAGSESYGDLGGDSLGAVSLSLLLEEIFGVDVPVSTLLGPNANARQIAEIIDRLRAAEAGGGASFASVHGVDATVARACDLTLDAFLDATTMAGTDVTAAAAETGTVLITGATGFLGRFLCLEWLEHLAPSGGKVICLVRGHDAVDARTRLDAAIGRVDPDLTARFHALAEGGLEVVAGDLAAPRLGMDDATYARLAGAADRIVHPGALVNHLLPYRALFAPNVAGTAELIRLALTGRRKRFDYVSTFGVPQTHPALAAAPEDVDLRALAPEMTISDGYAAGYTISKWAGEVLLREAHAHFGLPVTVFRPDMILGHRQWRGQVNAPDMFVRMLLSLALTGIAPESFYETGPDGSRPHAHYDGLPVDFLAAAIRRLCAAPDDEFRTCNTTSTHLDDGVSLDTIADWVASAGYRLERIADHGEWVRRFTGALRNLPEAKRQHSALPIIDHFARPHSSRPTAIRNNAFVAAAGSVPSIDEATIHKHLDDMRLLGLLPGREGAQGRAA
jgi:fatty acid CoA ligase FadD9